MKDISNEGDARLALLRTAKWRDEIERAVDRIKESVSRSKSDRWFRRLWYIAEARRKKERHVGDNQARRRRSAVSVRQTTRPTPEGVGKDQFLGVNSHDNLRESWGPRIHQMSSVPFSVSSMKSQPGVGYGDPGRRNAKTVSFVFSRSSSPPMT